MIYRQLVILKIYLKHAGRVLLASTGIYCVIDTTPITVANVVSQRATSTIEAGNVHLQSG